MGCLNKMAWCQGPGGHGMVCRVCEKASKPSTSTSAPQQATKQQQLWQPKVQIKSAVDSIQVINPPNEVSAVSTSSSLLPPEGLGSPPLSPKTAPYVRSVKNLQSNLGATRKEAGRERAKNILAVFEKSGLLLRSLSMKGAECLTVANIVAPTGAQPKAQANAFLDCWSYACSDFQQPLFQLSSFPGAGDKRAVGLLVDWTQTADRFVAIHETDQTSSKQLKAEMPLMSAQDAKQKLQELHLLVANKKLSINTEIQTIQIDKRAFVGLLWGPTFTFKENPDGAQDWDNQTKKLSLSRGRAITTRENFWMFVCDLAAKAMKPDGQPVITDGLPVFTYRLEGTSTYLDYHDFIGLSDYAPVLSNTL